MVGRRVHAAAQLDRPCADGDTVLSIVDAAAVWEDVDVGAFGPELAVALRIANGVC